MEKTRKTLTPAQQHFADEWLIDHNGTHAYKVAYPSVKRDRTAQTAASRLLSNVMVVAYIKAKQTEIAAKYNVTHQRTLEEEACIAFAAISQAFKGGALLHPGPKGSGLITFCNSYIFSNPFRSK